jgi:hypothetical protein
MPLAADRQGQSALWHLDPDVGFDRMPTGSNVRWVEGFVPPTLPVDDDDLPSVPMRGQNAALRRVVEPAVWAPPEPTRDVFVPLQRWEGVVLEAHGESFTARLTDLSADGPIEEVELQRADVADDDWALIQPGAVFYWSIGYMDSASGQRSRVSTLRFRRLPVWSSEELEASERRASEIAEVLAQ